LTQWPKYVKISKDIMKFVTDQQLKNYKLKFIPDCLRQWNIDLYILLECSVGMDCRRIVTEIL
jgi:hypothetical protein